MVAKHSAGSMGFGFRADNLFLGDYLAMLYYTSKILISGMLPFA